MSQQTPPNRGFTPPPVRRKPPIIPASRPLPRPANVMFARKSDSHHADAQTNDSARPTMATNNKQDNRLDDLMRNLEMMADDISELGNATANPLVASQPQQQQKTADNLQFEKVIPKQQSNVIMPLPVQSVASSERTFSEERRKFTAEIQSITVELQKCRSNLQTERVKSSQELDVLKSAAKQQQSRIIKLEQELAGAGAERDQETAALRLKLARSIEDSRNLGLQIEQLQLSLRSSQQEAITFKNQLEASRAEQEKLQTNTVSSEKYFQLETRMEQTLIAARHLEQLIKEKEDSLLASRLEESRLRDGLEAAEQQCQQLLADVKQLEERLKVQTDAAEASKKSSAAEQQIQRQCLQVLEAENGSLEEQLRNAVNRMNGLQQQLDVISMRENREVGSATMLSASEIDQAASEVERLRKELQLTRQELDQLRTEQQQHKRSEELSTPYRDQVRRLKEEFMTAEQETLAGHEIREQQMIKRIQELENQLASASAHTNASEPKNDVNYHQLARENAKLRHDLEEMHQMLTEERQSAETSIDEWERWANGIQQEAEQQIKEQEEAYGRLEAELHQVRKRFGKIIKEQEESIQSLLTQQNHIIEQMARGTSSIEHEQ